MKIIRLLLVPFLILFTIGFIFVQTKSVFANESPFETGISIKNQEQVTVKLFWGEGCPHCEAADSFLDSIQQNFSNLVVEKYEVYYNKENQDLMKNEAERLGVDLKGVPFIVIGNEYISGYQ